MKAYLFCLILLFVLKTNGQEIKLPNKNITEITEFSSNQIYQKPSISPSIKNTFFERNPNVFDYKRTKRIRISGFTFIGLSIGSMISSIAISRYNFKKQESDVPFTGVAALLGGSTFLFAIISFPQLGIGVHMYKKQKRIILPSW